MSLTIWNEAARGGAACVVVLPTGATEQHGPHLATAEESAVLLEIVIWGSPRCWSHSREADEPPDSGVSLAARR